MLDCGYAGAAQLLSKLIIDRCLALDLHSGFLIYRPISGILSHQTAHSDDDCHRSGVGGDGFGSKVSAGVRW